MRQHEHGLQTWMTECATKKVEEWAEALMGTDSARCPIKSKKCSLTKALFAVFWHWSWFNDWRSYFLGSSNSSIVWCDFWTWRNASKIANEVHDSMFTFSRFNGNEWILRFLSHQNTTQSCFGSCWVATRELATTEKSWFTSFAGERHDSHEDHTQNIRIAHQRPSYDEETINVPSRLKWTAETGSEWAGNDFKHFPVFTSQILTLSSN